MPEKCRNFKLAVLVHVHAVANMLAALREKEWVVYAKEPQDSEHILKYLARYTHRVALSNHRLVALQDGQVSFRFKDHKRGGQLRTQTLKAVDSCAGSAFIFCPRASTKSAISAILPTAIAKPSWPSVALYWGRGPRTW